MRSLASSFTPPSYTQKMPEPCATLLKDWALKHKVKQVSFTRLMVVMKYASLTKQPQSKKPLMKQMQNFQTKGGLWHLVSEKLPQSGHSSRLKVLFPQ
mmetsp:Transcript_13310/g.21455  ORF Transcript_13310/g.21455 Transcript_13310/m.21455 type:complete len:98 (+) Transcript_13310:188-481(+)